MTVQALGGGGGLEDWSEIPTRASLQFGKRLNFSINPRILSIFYLSFLNRSEALVPTFHNSYIAGAFLFGTRTDEWLCIASSQTAQSQLRMLLKPREILCTLFWRCEGWGASFEIMLLGNSIQAPGVMKCVIQRRVCLFCVCFLLFVCYFLKPWYISQMLCQLILGFVSNALSSDCFCFIQSVSFFFHPPPQDTAVPTTTMHLMTISCKPICHVSVPAVVTAVTTFGPPMGVGRSVVVIGTSKGIRVGLFVELHVRFQKTDKLSSLFWNRRVRL